MVIGTPVDPEDAKLVTLARAARTRTGAGQAAAVRDIDGRTYVAVGVSLPALQLSALQVAVAMAVSSGAGELATAVVLGDDHHDAAGVAAVRNLSPAANVLYRRGRSGQELSDSRAPTMASQSGVPTSITLK